MSSTSRIILVAALVILTIVGLFLVQKHDSPRSKILHRNQDYHLDPPGLADLEMGDVDPGVPVLCYHYFRSSFNAGYFLKVLGSVFFGMPALGAKEFWTTPVSQFEKHLEYFRDTNTQVLTLDEVATLYQNGEPIPSRAVVLTIDDADISVYKYAWPLLKKYGVKAHLFVPTAMVGTKWSSLNLCNWDQLREMSDSGNILIGSHTRSLHFKTATDDGPEPVFLHPQAVPAEVARGNQEILSHFDDKQWQLRQPAPASRALTGPLGPVAEDLLASRLDIIQGVGRAPTWLAWPYGFASDQLDSLTKIMGFRGTVSLRPTSYRPEDENGYVGRFTLTAKSTLDRISLVFPDNSH